VQEPLVVARLLPHLLLSELLLLIHLGNGRDDCLREDSHEEVSERNEVRVVSLDLPFEGIGHNLKDEGGVVDVACHLACDDLVSSVKSMLILGKG
jgi:hypothetical protein